MPEEIFDADGNPIEPHDEDGNVIEGGVFSKAELDEKVEETKSELDEKVEEKEEEWNEKIAAKDEEIEQIKTDIEEGKAGDKAKNLTGLRKKLQDTENEKAEKEKELKEFREETGKEINGIKESLSKRTIKDACEKEAGGDEELAKKIEGYFNTFNPITETDPKKKAEIFQERISSAKILANGGSAGDEVAKIVATNGGYVPGSPGVATQEKPSEEVKDMGKDKMGISKEDFKNHDKAKAEGIL